MMGYRLPLLNNSLHPKRLGVMGGVEVDVRRLGVGVPPNGFSS